MAVITHNTHNQRCLHTQLAFPVHTISAHFICVNPAAVPPPSIPLGFRGSVGLEVVLQTLTQDVHSGLFGGSVDNAPLALARLLATLHDASGAIAIDGYYECVVSLPHIAMLLLAIVFK